MRLRNSAGEGEEATWQIEPSTTRCQDRLTVNQEGRRGALSPRIYVVSLDDYRNDRDHGEWIDADQDPEEVRAEINAMLASSIVPGATEWSIHDFEGFGEIDASNLDTVEAISAVGLGVAEHGSAFAAYADWAGTDSETLAKFHESYEGFWSSVNHYAERLAEEMDWPGTLDRVVPEGMRLYVEINYSALAADVEAEMHIVRADGGVYVFLNI